jgi:L-threonylcarbamoyladenylate synthase
MRYLPVTDETLHEAAAALRAGELVAFPTETVYGLGADAFNTIALAKVFEAKKRPRFDPLIVHIAAFADIARVADLRLLDARARANFDALVRALWPGPLTFIVPKQAAVPDLATSALPTVALRFPDHAVARALIRLSTGAIAAPSANPFGYLSPTRAGHVREQLGDKVSIILDGGPCGIGVESTVLDLTRGEARILRPGGTPRERIEAVIGKVSDTPPSKVSDTPPPISPGQLKSHYAPRTPLQLHAREAMLALPALPTAAYLFFDEETRDAWVQTRGQTPHSRPLDAKVLSEAGDLVEAASVLFDTLHELDHAGVSTIHVQRVPDSGLGCAINDRLTRAAERS